MKLVDRYVSEVGKRLPRRQRRDIEAEIRSALEDTLEDRSRESGKPVDDAMVLGLLKEYGSPEKVAGSYQAPRYLVGPRMYPFFEMVVKIVLAVLLGVGLFGLGANMLRSGMAGPEFISSLGKWALGLLGGMISAVGNIVIVFAILERTMPTKELGIEAGEWDPRDLEKEPDPNQVEIASMIATVIFLTAGLVIFNLYPDAVAFYFLENGKWTTIPVLAPAFFSYLPWINILGLLEIGLSLLLLRQGVWGTFTRLANLLLEIAGVVLAAFMLIGPSLVSLSAETLAGTPLAETLPSLLPLFGILPALVLTILIIVQSVEIAQGIYRLVRR